MGIFNRIPTIPEEQADWTWPVNEVKAQTIGYEEVPSRNGEKWAFGLPPIVSATSISLDHYSTRQQARLAMQDSLHARSIVERYADTVIDSGLRLRPSPLYKEIGISSEEASEWSRSVGSRFHAYASKKTCSRDETENLYQAQRKAEIFQQRDNDYFVRFIYSKPTGRRTSSVQFQFIDADQVSGGGYLKDGTTIANVEDGIQRDPESGKETGYIVETWNGKEFIRKYIPAEKNGRVHMVHAFQAEYAGQQRGLSRMSHAIQELSNLTDFSSSHIQQAINQASIAMTVESDTEAPASNPFEDLASRRGAGPVTGLPTATGLAARSHEPNLQNELGFYSLPDVRFSKPGSVGVFNLKGRERLKPFNASAPSDSYDSFVGSFMSHLAASLSIPLEVVLMKFGANYSASRAALILFWRVAGIWQGEMVSDWLDTFYEMWLLEEIAEGRVSAPGFLNQWIRDCWLCNTWRGQPMPNIDPAKTAVSDKSYLEMGAHTLSDVALNLNGSDFNTNVAENAAGVGKLPVMPWTPLAIANMQSQESPEPKKSSSDDTEEEDEDNEDE